MDDDVYQDRQDQTVTVGLRLESGELASSGRRRPGRSRPTWRSPSGRRLRDRARPGSGPLAGERSLAKARLAAYAKELGEEPEIVAEYRVPICRAGSITRSSITTRAKTTGRSNAWQIRVADYVSTEDGTGLVHIAPDGEDDMSVYRRAEIKVIETVDPAGKFFGNITDYAGLNVFDANRPIMNATTCVTALAHRNASTQPSARCSCASSPMCTYPHCWRCRKPPSTSR